MKERKYLEKHVELIQNSIDRMSSNCLNIKGWLIGLITAGFIFVSDEYSVCFMLSSLILIFGFAFLDAKYLQYERKFRELYKIVVEDQNQEKVKDLEMNINNDFIKQNKKTRYINCLISPSIWIAYGVILTYNVILLIISL